MVREAHQRDSIAHVPGLGGGGAGRWMPVEEVLKLSQDRGGKVDPVVAAAR